MNKRILIVSVLFMAASMVLFTGCSDDDDTEAPVITLNGDNPFTITSIGTAYVEPGYSATDNEDGDLTSSVIVDKSGVDEDETGVYSVEYSVSDAAGNTGYESREVNVLNAADFLKGTYGVLIQTPGFADYNHTDQIKMSSTVNNKIIFGKFGNYASAEDDVYGNVTQVGGTFISITIPSQTVNCGTPLADRTFSGNGTISVVGSSVIITMTINEAIVGQATVTSTYTYTRS